MMQAISEELSCLQSIAACHHFGLEQVQKGQTKVNVELFLDVDVENITVKFKYDAGNYKKL